MGRWCVCTYVCACVSFLLQSRITSSHPRRHRRPDRSTHPDCASNRGGTDTGEGRGPGRTHLSPVTEETRSNVRTVWNVSQDKGVVAPTRWHEEEGLGDGLTAHGTRFTDGGRLGHTCPYEPMCDDTPFPTMVDPQVGNRDPGTQSTERRGVSFRA